MAGAAQRLPDGVGLLHRAGGEDRRHQAITFLKALHRALDALDEEALAAAQARHDAMAAQKLVQKVLLSSMIGEDT